MQPRPALPAPLTRDEHGRVRRAGTPFMLGALAIAGCLRPNPAWDAEPGATASSDGAPTSDDAAATGGATSKGPNATLGDASSTTDDTTGTETGGGGEDIDTALVLHLRLDETQGAIAQDASPTDATCTLEGSPTWIPAHRDGGLELDPSDDVDYVLCDGDAALLDAQIGDYSLAAWVHPMSTPGPEATDPFALVVRSGFDLGLFYESSEEFSHYDWQADTTGAALFSLTSFAPGAWHHVATTVDRAAGELRLYIDGALVDETDAVPGASGYDYEGAPWQVGYDMPGAAHAAHVRIDDVRIYARALSAEQVAALAAD